MSDTTNTYPLDTIVEITDEIGGQEYQASGVLIAPNEVLTASHVVYQEGEPLATDVVVAPGADGVSSPFGTANGIVIHYNPVDDGGDTISSAASQSDYAVIQLSSAFTNLGTMTIDPNFSGGAATVSGYPGSYGGQQVEGAQVVQKDPDYTLFDGRSLGPGSSGGPVWFTGSNGQAEVVGLVSSGSFRTGYDVEITPAVAARIAAWVAEDDGAAPASATGTSTVASGNATETVTGVAGGTITIAFPAATSALAATLMGELSTDIAAGLLVAETATPGQAPPAFPAGVVGQLDISQAGAVTLTAGYGALVDSASGQVNAALTTGQNVSVVAGAGGLVLNAGQTSGTLVGAGGNTVFYAGAASGSWKIALAAGANTIVAGAGADSIAAGAGANLIFLGTGADCVAAAGTDTIIGGGGAATVAATGDALVFGFAGTLTFFAGAAASTVVGAAGGNSVTGGAGPLLYFGAGATSYTGGTGDDTILGGAGSLTARGGTGADLLIGGAAGNNILTGGGGADTLLGGAGGMDVLSATGGANAVLAAGAGAETLTAAASTGNNSFFAGAGSDVLIGGAGASAMIAGGGAATMTAGAGGAIFGFVDGAGGGTDLVTNFNARLDQIVLRGYGANAAATASRTAVVTGGATILTLPDNTRITFAGVSSLDPASFS